MPSGQLNQVLRQLCRLAGARSVEELGDRQLLEAFAAHHDAEAFTVLVQRHGPLVLGICRRVLHDEHDAEDVFQATFLVLAKKAGSIRRQEAVGSWLCGTAYRIALKARAAAGRRREQERQTDPMTKVDPETEADWLELRPVLDEELNRLPPKYRAPLVLCYLQGKTNEAAAKELGWAPGSMSYRLAQARDLLRTRLQQRGVALSSVALAAALAQNATAAVQAPLLDATVRASVAFVAGEAAASAQVVALAEAGLQSLRLAQLKLVAAVALAAVVMVGGVGIAWKLLPTSPKAPITTPMPTPDNEPRLLLAFSESQRFGVSCLRLHDPGDSRKPKRLTREANGITNNTCFRIDGNDYLFGQEIPGVRWGRNSSNKAIKGLKIDDRAWQSVIEHEPSKVRITQTVELIRGEQSGLYDTVFVKYVVRNNDALPHNVGLRFLLDTLIGANDGTPFSIPPTDLQSAKLVDGMEIFEKGGIPDFVRALETDNLEDTNATVAELNLKLQGYEPLSRLVICRWPDNSEIRWDWTYRPVDDVKDNKDSCVAMYWADRPMRAGEERLLGFTYGLGAIWGEGQGGSVSGGGGGTGGKLRLMTAGSNKIGRTFTATAYVKGEMLVGQRVSLRLPPGLELVPGQKLDQDVPRMGTQGYSQVSWRVRSTQPGRFKIATELAGNQSNQEVTITDRSLFD